jgi:Protein of unknown function (DUF1614)
MHVSHLHYLPLPLPSFSILVAIFLALSIALQLGILRYAYMRLGSHLAAPCFCSSAPLSAATSTSRAAICYHLAEPIAGLGIALPVFVPALATSIVALLLSRDRAAPLAYVAGSLGTLIGADLLNLGSIQGIGAPMASIGGAGTFDGIFLNAVLAVVIASMPGLFRAPASGFRQNQKC